MRSGSPDLLFIEENGELAGGGSNGFRLTNARPQTPVECPQGRVRFTHAHRGHAQQRCRAVRGSTRLGAQHPATRDLVARCQGQPGGKVLRRWPPAHVIAAFGDEPQGQVRPDTVDLDRIDPEQSLQRGLNGECRFVLLSFAPSISSKYSL